MRWEFWQKAQAFLRPGAQVLYLGERPDPRFPLGPEDGPFDVVLCYHVRYDLARVLGLLKPGGFFLTEQVGGVPVDYNLENEAPRFRQAGLRVVYADQGYDEADSGVDHRFMITAGRRKSP